MEYVLEVKDISKYFGKRRILNHVNLNVRPGEVMGFIGPNGAGKTTAIKVVLGFLSDDGGDISICGYDVKKDYEKAMGCVGGIVENPDMYRQFSGRMNLEMYARTHENVTKERIDEVVKLVGLENRIDDKVKKYSLGMKQRLGLAMAMLHRPKLLILDEPTNGLDPAGIKELRDILTELAHRDKVGVLISSHQLAEMQNICDRAAIIVNGNIVCENTLEELNAMASGEPEFIMSVEDPRIAIAEINAFFDELRKNSKTADDAGAVVYAEVPQKHVTCNAETGELVVKAGKNLIPQIVKRVAVAGAGVYEVRQGKNSLEDAFIAITGGGNTIA